MRGPAAEPEHLLATGVDAVGGDPRLHRVEHGVLVPGRGADDRERAGEQERADGAHRAGSCLTGRPGTSGTIVRSSVRSPARLGRPCTPIIERPSTLSVVIHEKRIEIRWRDCDAYRHVNNAVYATYLEECRDEWLVAALGSDADLPGTTCSRGSRSTSVGS